MRRVKEQREKRTRALPLKQHRCPADNGLPSPPVEAYEPSSEDKVLGLLPAQNTPVATDPGTPDTTVSSKPELDEATIRQKLQQLEKEKHELFQLMKQLLSEQQQQQQQQPQQPQQQHTLQSTPLKSQSASSSLLDLNFGPSPSVNTTGGSGTSVSSTQPAINSGRSSRPDLKKSILALYSTPSTYNKPASAITPNATNNINNLFGQPSAPPTYQSSASLGGLNNSLAGLNLAGGSNNTPSNFAANTSSANIWGSSSTGTGSGSSSTTSNSNINNKTPLDDDLFKNVWS